MIDDVEGSKSPSFKVVCDANVLYPPKLRDLLIRLHGTGLVKIRWSDQILDEMVRAVLRGQPWLKEAMERIVLGMQEAVPDASVTGYEAVIPKLRLPDPDDRHVLATAIVSKANIIITNNLKDFPQAELDVFQIYARSPDAIILQLLEDHPERVIGAVAEQAMDTHSPVLSLDELVDRLGAGQIPRSATAVREFLGLADTGGG